MFKLYTSRLATHSSHRVPMTTTHLFVPRKKDASNPPSPHLTNGLLFHAHVLACDVFLELAKNRLREIWDGRLPPPASRSSPSPDLPLPDFMDVIYTIQLARQHSISEVLKHALYEVLSSGEGEFCRALDGAMSGKGSPKVLSALSVARKD
ncbi:hypothetical protein GSI_08450 [Ganoderma sinense ZZ0214-1]|uniref:Uncharacterized protein n=1 Tax=Ganoderma sinense ZZ0214-1 TaxID=1077348 RepID=A0A2G8S3R6_9APHY|nr:hypothetical protein GSI_08450 [Ganoderma sinense ZZ0214-1]